MIDVSSVPWSNETERADYYEKLYNEQLAICDRVDAERRALLFTVKSLSGQLSTGIFESVKQFAEELKYTLTINNEYNTETLDYYFTMQTIDDILDRRVGK